MTQKTKVTAGCLVPEDSLGAVKPRDRLREAVSCHAPSPQNSQGQPTLVPVFVTISVCSWVGPVGHPCLPPNPAHARYHLASVCLSAGYPPPHMRPPHLWTGGRGQGRMGPGTAAAAGRRARGGGR